MDYVKKEGNMPTVEELLDALDSVTWYNGIGEDIREWKDLPIDDEGSIICPYELFAHDTSKEVIWMICVCLFGEYGTSPRSGWIENVEGFKAFIDEITKTEREDREND